MIAHPGGLRSTFEPVSATVSVGALVRQGEVIGLLSAQPGHCAPASCLHWGVLRGEVFPEAGEPQRQMFRTFEGEVVTCTAIGHRLLSRPARTMNRGGRERAVGGRRGPGPSRPASA